MGNLQTFEMEINKEDKFLKKNKGITFEVITLSSGSDSKTNVSEIVDMLTKKFSTILKRAKGKEKVRGANPKVKGFVSSQKPNSSSP